MPVLRGCPDYRCPDNAASTVLSDVSYYPAHLFTKKSKLASKSGSNKWRDLLTGELLTEVYCNIHIYPRYKLKRLIFGWPKVVFLSGIHCTGFRNTEFSGITDILAFPKIKILH